MQTITQSHKHTKNTNNYLSSGKPFDELYQKGKITLGSQPLNLSTKRNTLIIGDFVYHKTFTKSRDPNEAIRMTNSPQAVGPESLDLLFTEFHSNQTCFFFDWNSNPSKNDTMMSSYYQ